MLRLRRNTIRWRVLLLLLTLAVSGCGARRPKTVEASAEQEKKWEEEENAAREKKLQEARARGAVH